MSKAPSIASSQEARLQRFRCTRTVDTHCHVLPGVDDGPRSMSDSLSLCRALIADGFTDVIATPHQLGRWDGSNAPIAIRAGVAELQAQLNKARLPLSVHAGAEVRLDERIPQFLGAGKILTLADQGIYLLLELPLGLSVDPAFLVPYLTRTGAKLVLAHAERYDSLVASDALLETWVRQGAAIQVNAPSLCGDDAEAQAAWRWMQKGWVAVVATDAHSTNTRRPRMTEALEVIVNRLGEDVARRVCIENPARILEGRELLSVDRNEG
ncbi:MAG TPA: CpsB/CapC family capsule biosynthesis tyrosine phosphatase [Dongiaceae bacterium]|nr:CpsB/CapC family capsule biosynthesis tyrosine phosphatase [Dongiaceae bacterium]